MPREITPDIDLKTLENNIFSDTNSVSDDDSMSSSEQRSKFSEKIPEIISEEQSIINTPTQVVSSDRMQGSKAYRPSV